MKEWPLIYSITDHDTPNQANQELVKAPVDSTSITALVIAILEDRKAINIVSINIREKSDFADCMIVANGTSSRHASSISQHVIHGLKSAGLEPRVEGMDAGEWILVDAGDVVIHLFHPEVREYYKIEKMWGVPNLADIQSQELEDS